MNLDLIQQELRAASLDGWLFFDHHERDPLAYRLLGLKPTSLGSRASRSASTGSKPRTHECTCGEKK